MSIFSRILIFLLLTGPSLALETPGPSAALLANPTYSGGIGLLYTCVNNYYVNGSTGNNSNNGTSPSSAWATIQHADTLPRSPGDCINVAAGTYTWGSTFTPTRGGNQASPTGYVVYKCQVLDQCFIVFNGTPATPILGFTNPYYIIDGFDIDGGEASRYGGIASICFASSLPDTITPGHHLWVLNNNIHGCSLAGVTFSDSEYYFVLHNNISDCAWTSPFEGSGLGYVTLKALGDNLNPYPAYTPTVSDLAFAPFHNMVSWNHVFNNGCTECTGFFSTPPTGFQTTANTNSTATLSNLASIGTSASFTGAIVNTTLTVSGITGSISVGDVLSGTSLPTVPVTVVTAFISGIGGNGTYTVNFDFGSPGLGPETVTTATIAPAVFVQGPGIQPMTYINTVFGNSAVLSRPALTTQTGGTFTFGTLNFGHTDGNGIIMDTWCGIPCGGSGSQPYNYTDKQTLISFNDVQFNGGRGIHIFAAYENTVINNSTYHNGLDLYSNGLLGELSEQGGTNNSWYNNVAWAFGNIAPSCNSFSITCNFAVVAGNGRGITDLNTKWFNNNIDGTPVGAALLFDNDTVYWQDANNKPSTNPLYVDGTSNTIGDLHLQANSPSINYANGASFSFIPRGTTDAGAWQTGGTRSVFDVIPFPDFPGSIGLQPLSKLPTPLSCPEATAWLARISGPDRAHQDAYSNLICGMVSAGIWCGTTMDIFYVFATYDQVPALLNLCSTNYTAILNGPPAFTKDRGYLGVDSSTTVYIDTGFNPSTAGGNYTANSAELSVWINNNAFASSGFVGVVIGAAGNPGGLTDIFPGFNNGGGGVNFEANVNNNIQNFGAVTNQPSTLGHFLAQRTSAIDVAAYYNATQRFAYTQAENIPTYNIVILAINSQNTIGGGAPNQVGAVTIGASLTTPQISSLCHLLNVYMVAVGNTQVASSC